MYNVFGDESHDAKKSRVFAVAGLFGNDEDWTAATDEWLARTAKVAVKGVVFHATDCDSDRGDFVQFSHDENKKLYRHLTQVVANSKLMGFGAALSVADYERVFGDQLDYKPYFFCFSEVVAHFARIAHVCLPQAQVKYTFEHNNRVEYDAATAYEYALSLKEWPYYKYLYPQELSFGFRTNPAIQMADLFARETMKHLDNQVGPQWCNTRGSFRALQSTGRFQYHFFAGGYFEDLRRRTEELEMERDGRSPTQYVEWCKERHLSDTISTRIKYQMFLDQIDRVEGHEPVNLSGHGPTHK